MRFCSVTVVLYLADFLQGRSYVEAPASLFLLPFREPVVERSIVMSVHVYVCLCVCLCEAARRAVVSARDSRYL